MFKLFCFFDISVKFGITVLLKMTLSLLLCLVRYVHVSFLPCRFCGVCSVLNNLSAVKD